MGKKSFRINQVSAFVLLFISFALTLTLLLGYLYKIDYNLKQHSIYKDNIEEIVLLDQKLNNFFLKKYQYLDYDEVSKVTDRLFQLFDSTMSSGIYPMHQKEILDLKSLYEKKYALVENFKSLNARMTNALHYMFDLRKSIQMADMEGDRKKLSDEIFFQITQLTMDIPIDREKLKKDMSALQSLVTEDCKCGYFMKQVNRFLSEYGLMKSYIQENQEIGFHRALEETLAHLREEHDSDIYQQKVIALLFFGLAFFVLFLLIINYRKVIRTSRELQAFRYAIENSDNVVLITDTDRNITYVNDAFEGVTGYKKSEVIGEKPSILKSDKMSREFYEEMNSILDQGKKWQGELINKRKDGSLLYEKASISPIIIDDEIVQYLAVKLDISHYIEAQNRLKQSATVFESTQEGILILNDEKKIDSVNSAFMVMTGYEQSELDGKSLDIFASEKNGPDFYAEIWDLIQKDHEWTGKVNIRHKDGTEIPIWLSLNSVSGKDNKVINYIALFTDLTEVMRTQEKADFLAYHDSLTLLPNRAHYEKYMEKLFEKESIKSAAVMFLDLDRFKVINDTLGHSVGDELLKKVADRISRTIELDFFLARLGGDEFVIVLENIPDTETVTTCAKELLSNINIPIIVSRHQLNVSASIGISLYPEHSKDPESLTRYADNAMYRAKDKGKNTYAYYDKQLSLEVHSRLNVEQRLKTAWYRQEITLAYQPQYDLASHEIVGIEVLIRWHNDTLGDVSPEVFIPIAEDTGLIIDIGYKVFETACRNFVKWRAEGCTLQHIAFNISSVQLRQGDFLEKIEAIMKSCGIEGKYIEIELTERILFEFSDSNIDIINSFRKMGCEVSIDDFGTGYSSMNYLRELPIDTVKIDKAFIQELPHNIYDQKVSNAIIALSKNLGYKVIAEGIENAEQEKFLLEHGCDIGQGYHFSKPLTEEQFIDFVKNNTPKA